MLFFFLNLAFSKHFIRRNILHSDINDLPRLERNHFDHAYTLSNRGHDSPSPQSLPSCAFQPSTEFNFSAPDLIDTIRSTSTAKGTTWATSTASQERSPLRFFCPHQRRRHRVSLETVPELDLIRLTHFRHFWNAAESRFLEQRSNDSFPSVRALIKIVIYVPTGSKLDRVHHNHRAGRSNSSGSW